TVSFTWDRRPSADDREEWSFAILAHGLHRALDQAFLERAMVEQVRNMVAEGLFERVGISRAGDWVFCRTKDAAPLPPGVVGLTAKRRERLSRTNMPAIRGSRRTAGSAPDVDAP